MMRKSPARSRSPSPAPVRTLEPALDSPEIAKILLIKQNFQKNIETPIQSMQALDNAKTAQRCLYHNTILTLYCEIDRKPLCANCMYQQDTHRKHRVVPISKAMNMIREDITSFENKLEGSLAQCLTISKKLQENIIRNERHFPTLVNRLKEYYTSMAKMIQEKEKEHINQITELQQKLKNEVVFLDQEVKRIANYIVNKLKGVKKVETDETTISRRGILQTLSKVTKTIHGQFNDFFPDEDKTNVIDFNLYQDIFQLVKNKLVVVLPGLSIQPRSRHRLNNCQLRRALTPSPGDLINKKTDFEAKSPAKSQKKKNAKQVKFQLF